MEREGPSPLMIVIILILCILALGAVFGAIKIFLLEKPALLQEEGSVELYFCQTQDCRSAMVQHLNRSRSINCAFYELNDPVIIGTLAEKNAHVLVYDKEADVEGLAVEKVPSKGLMHDKFCILDDRTVITGSMNPTINDIERNDNNLLVIESPSMAKRYTQEFEELVGRTDRTYEKRSPKPFFVNLSGVLIEQRFCPQENCEGAAIRTVLNAKEEIDFMLFTFTSDPLGDALITAHNNGVVVRGVFENRQGDEYSEQGRLNASGATVKLDGNKYTMHHKVMILDNMTVLTGSYNPTSSAQTKNDENMLIINDERIAKAYYDEFTRVNALAKPLR
jgi:phosphatidylserine/phosphatidylglycerophosphate/cardiolipin synthase-like enzyme